MTEHMSHPEYVQLQRSRALDAARGIVSGQRTVIEGCRYLSDIRFGLELPELQDAFDGIVAIASESDPLPVGEVRKYWAADALKQQDIEIAGFEEFYRNAAIQACAALIPKLERAVQPLAPP